MPEGKVMPEAVILEVVVMPEAVAVTEAGAMLEVGVMPEGTTSGLAAKTGRTLARAGAHGYNGPAGAVWAPLPARGRPGAERLEPPAFHSGQSCQRRWH